MIYKKWYSKFRRSDLRLIILVIVSFVAGLHLIIDPTSVKHWVIRGVGLVWVIEAVSYSLELYRRYLSR